MCANVHLRLWSAAGCLLSNLCLLLPHVSLTLLATLLSCQDPVLPKAELLAIRSACSL